MEPCNSLSLAGVSYWWNKRQTHRQQLVCNWQRIKTTETSGQEQDCLCCLFDPGTFEMNNIKFLPSLNKPELYNEQMNSISSATEKNLSYITTLSFLALNMNYNNLWFYLYETNACTWNHVAWDLLETVEGQEYVFLSHWKVTYLSLILVFTNVVFLCFCKLFQNMALFFLWENSAYIYLNKHRWKSPN